MIWRISNNLVLTAKMEAKSVVSLSLSLSLSLSRSLSRVFAADTGPRVPSGGVTRQGVLTDHQSPVDCQ